MNIKPYLELCRVSNLPTVWTNVLAAVVLTGLDFSLPLFVLLALSMSLFYSGGMCLNDINDLAYDRQKKSSRPIASGKISIGHALVFTAVLFTGAVFLLTLVPYNNAVYPGLLLLLFIVIYDKFHKAHPLSVLVMAACRLMVFITSAIAVSGTAGVLVLIAGFIQFAYIVIMSLVARHESSIDKPFTFPVIPLMLACISLLDGLVLAVIASPLWLTVGISGMALTLLGQRYVRGD